VVAPAKIEQNLSGIRDFDLQIIEQGQVTQQMSTTLLFNILSISTFAMAGIWH